MNWVDILVFALPVALAAVGESINQRSGVLNIGLEGLMLVAAFVAMVVSQSSGSPWVGFAAGVVAAIALNTVQSILTLVLARDQVVVGTAINLLALGLTSTLHRARLGVSQELLSVPKLPKFLGIDAVVLAAAIVVLLLTWLLQRTAWGLALRASGEYPPAVRTAGFSVLGLRWQAGLIGAALAGAGGAYLTLGITGSFTDNVTGGRGFVALAMVAFGRWTPVGSFGACLLVGAAETLRYAAQARFATVPHQLLAATPYLLALAVLVVIGKGGRSPQALGQPLNEGSRV